MAFARLCRERRKKGRADQPNSRHCLFGRIDSVFAREKHAVRRKKIPVPAHWEFTFNAMELLRNSTSARAKTAGNSQNSLLRSL
jgi:hypothetical protein